MASQTHETANGSFPRRAPGLQLYGIGKDAKDACSEVSRLTQMHLPLTASLRLAPIAPAHALSSLRMDATAAAPLERPSTSEGEYPWSFGALEPMPALAGQRTSQLRPPPTC